MFKKVLIAATAALFLCPKISFGQAPTMGSTINYTLFTSAGAVSNTGLTRITGNVGTQLGAITSFGNIDGVFNSANGETTLAVADLNALYTQLFAIPTTDTHPAVLGSGEVVIPGVYQIAAAGSITGTLTLDAEDDEDAIFVFKVGGAFTTAAATKVLLINGAKACNVFWIAEGAIGMAAGTKMKGTLIAHNAAISMAAGGNLEGRMFSTAGAVAIDGTTAYLPLGCSMPILTGPAAPDLATTECFALFSADGTVKNTAITTVTGDVGSNLGATTGFDSTSVIGAIHSAPDSVTATCATDLATVYAYLNTLIFDIELEFPAAVGNKLVLTPHIYFMDGPTSISDTLFLNAQGNADAIFVLKVAGKLTSTPDAVVMLINGALPNNVFWLVNGAVDIKADSKFKGNIVSGGGKIDMATGTDLQGRAFTTDGNIAVNNTTAVMPSVCFYLGINDYYTTAAINVYPNPFTASFNLDLKQSPSGNNCQINIYDAMGKLVLTKTLTAQFNTVETNNLSSGIYFYKVSNQEGIIQTGRLVSQQ